ncbi:dehydrogenase [Burkholderia ambifaria IOP40-10]|uniref:Dehydrogenase n=1 Tax=Burkholderia ambifaria IOP40-10 TaxID=396596 RepID=B1FRW6_9BURK|nr:dehydrogenase [Burkholderia ambifaria IOP40-10]
MRREVEPREQLVQLRVRLLRVQVAAAYDRAALQQLAVAGQHDPAFARGERDEFVVAVVVVVAGVEAGEAQQLREAAEMRVGDEAPALRLLQHGRFGGRPRAFRMDVDAVAVAKWPVEGGRRAVHAEPADFRMRDAERLDRVLDRRIARKRMRERALALRACEKRVQFAVEAEGRGRHARSIAPRAAGGGGLQAAAICV